VPEVKLTKGWTPPGEPKPVPAPKPPREPLRRAKAWRLMLDEGVYPHQSALARGEGVTAAAVSLGLRKLRELGSSTARPATDLDSTRE